MEVYVQDQGFGKKVALCIACHHSHHGDDVCGHWRKFRTECPCSGEVIDESAVGVENATAIVKGLGGTR